MEDNNKKNDIPGTEETLANREEDVLEESATNEPEEARKAAAFPTEGDEFDLDAFTEDETEEAQAKPAAPAAASSAGNRLPWFLFAASLIAIAVILYMGQAESGIGGAAAKVNGQKVTKQDLYDAMYAQGGEAALDNLITEKLIAQEADKKQVQITDADVDAELQKIKDGFPDEQQFNDAMQQSGYTLDSLKKQIRTQVQLNKIFESQMDLSDAKQKEYFDKNQERYDTPEQIEVSHILVDAKEDADKILADLKAGGDFAATAKEKSTDTGTKDNGGSLGLVARGQGLDQAFEDAAFKLNKGEMSGVVQSSFGFHIIKVTDKKEAVKATFEDKKAEVRSNMVDEEVQTKAAEWMDGLKKDAKIEKL